MVIKYFEKLWPLISLRVSFDYDRLVKNDFACVSVVCLQNNVKIYILCPLKRIHIHIHGHIHDIDVYTYF